jgi:hypothetical protein
VWIGSESPGGVLSLDNVTPKRGVRLRAVDSAAQIRGQSRHSALLCQHVVVYTETSASMPGAPEQLGHVKPQFSSEPCIAGLDKHRRDHAPLAPGAGVHLAWSNCRDHGEAADPARRR